MVARQTDETSALIVRVRLPPALERLRRAHLPVEMRGLPAHCTLLFPFVAPGSLAATELAAMRSLVRRCPAHDIRLAGRGVWPEVLYATVDPDPRLDALQADLAAMFPSLPLYGGAFPFVPHVTVVSGPDAGDPAVQGHDAWRALPVTVPIAAVELISADGGHWRPRRRFPLGDGPGIRCRPTPTGGQVGVSRGPRRRGGP